MTANGIRKGAGALMAWMLGMGCGLWGYAALDDVQSSTPMWITWTAPDRSVPFIYRIRRGEGEDAVIDLRSRSPQPLTATVSVPGYHETTQPVQLDPGAETTLPLMPRRMDHGLFRAPLRVPTLRIGSGPEQSIPAAPAPPIDASTVAYPVVMVADHAGFRSEAVAYTARMTDAGIVDLHVRNASSNAIHADFRLVSYQPVGAVNPRLHLLPGRTIELMLAVPRADEHVARVLIELWNVRVGDDRGPALVADPTAAAHPMQPRRFAPSDGWTGVSLGDSVAAGFNPQAVVWQVATRPTGMTWVVRNRSAQALTFALRRYGRTELQPFDLPPAGESAIPLPAWLPATGAVAVEAVDVRIDGQPPRRGGPSARITMTGAGLPVVPRSASPRFNPHAVLCTIARAGGSDAKAGPQATVTLTNLTAADLHVDFAIAGYQGPDVANPRLHLPAGGSQELTVPVTRSDARLALAKVQVWNVRIGDDAGDLLCAVDGLVPKH